MKKLISLILSVAIAFCITIGSVSASEILPTAEEQASAYNYHSIGMIELGNARELGGYLTTDGKMIKFGKLLRTEKTSDASDEDLERLINVYHVKVQVDFRSQIEAITSKDPSIDGITNYQYSSFGSKLLNIDVSTKEGLDELTDYVKSIMVLDYNGNLIDNYFKNFYRDLYATDEGVTAFKNFFKQVHSLAENPDSDDAILWHCASGKDRTGNAAMLLMTILGVDEDTIMADFLNTNIYNSEKISEVYDLVYKISNNDAMAYDIAYNYGVQESWLETAYSYLEEKYGKDNAHDAVMAFVYDKEDGLGLTQDYIDLIRSAFLTDNIKDIPEYVQK